MDKRTFVRAGVIAALLVLTGGGATAIAMDKSITIAVDGEERTVHTFAGTVAGALRSAGLDAGKHDALAPSADTDVGDGSRIVLKRGRVLRLKVDGSQREVWVHARTVDEALRQLGMHADGAVLSADRSRRIPLDGLALDLKTAKVVVLADGGKEAHDVATNSATVEEMLKEQGVALEKGDVVSPAGISTLVTGMEIQVTRTRVTEVKETKKVEPPVEKTDDSTLQKGQQEVDDQGEVGEQIITFRVTTVNGVETAREQLDVKVTKEAKPKKVRVGTKPVADGDTWDRLAQCEAGGNWAANTGNSYYGGLQFNKSTWASNGGTAYAEYPHQASREQQIAIATKVRDGRGGYSAWPACSKKLGL